MGFIEQNIKEPLEIITVEDDVLILSLDQRALKKVGDIEDVEAAEEGDEVEQGDECVTIFGSDENLIVRAPIAGLVLEINEMFSVDIKKKKKGTAWLLKIEASDDADLFKFEE